MLTHEELMEKCQELCEAANLLLNAMLINNYIYDLTLEGHAYYMDNLTNGIESLMSLYLENRDNISDDDTIKIINTIMPANNIAILALGTDKNTSNSQLFNIIWNELKNNAN